MRGRIWNAAVTDAAFRVAMSGDLAVRCCSYASRAAGRALPSLEPIQPCVMPGTQEEAAERVDVAPRAAINRRTKDIGQLFGGKSRSANQPSNRKMLSIS